MDDQDVERLRSLSLGSGVDHRLLDATFGLCPIPFEKFAFSPFLEERERQFVVAAPEMFGKGGICEEAGRRAMELESCPVGGTGPGLARRGYIQLHRLDLFGEILDEDLSNIHVVSH